MDTKVTKTCRNKNLSHDLKTELKLYVKNIRTVFLNTLNKRSKWQKKET